MQEFNMDMIEEYMKNKLTRLEMQNNSKEYYPYCEIKRVVLLQVSSNQNLDFKTPYKLNMKGLI